MDGVLAVSSGTVFVVGEAAFAFSKAICLPEMTRFGAVGIAGFGAGGAGAGFFRVFSASCNSLGKGGMSIGQGAALTEKSVNCPAFARKAVRNGKRAFCCFFCQRS